MLGLYLTTLLLVIIVLFFYSSTWVLIKIWPASYPYSRPSAFKLAATGVLICVLFFSIVLFLDNLRVDEKTNLFLSSISTLGIATLLFIILTKKSNSTLTVREALAIPVRALIAYSLGALITICAGLALYLVLVIKYVAERW